MSKVHFWFLKFDCIFILASNFESSHSSFLGLSSFQNGILSKSITQLPLNATKAIQVKNFKYYLIQLNFYFNLFFSFLF